MAKLRRLPVGLKQKKRHDDQRRQKSYRCCCCCCSIANLFYWSMLVLVLFYVTNSAVIVLHMPTETHSDHVSSLFLHGVYNSSSSNNNSSNNNNNSNSNSPVVASLAGKDAGHQPNTTKATRLDPPQGQDELPVFAICLLTRDDVPILPEWIAYHYHSVRLRHLVVAVDPESDTDPKPVLDSFRTLLGGNYQKKSRRLLVEQWADKDFMPDYFVRGEYGKAPNFVGGFGEPDDSKTWEGWYSKQKHMGKVRIKDQTYVNNHRFRQTRFLSRCTEHLREKYSGNQKGDSNRKKNVWMATLDTDEYLAINPWMLLESGADASGALPADRETVDSVMKLEPASVLRWWVGKQNELQTKESLPSSQHANRNHPVCRQIPRLLFGSVEAANLTVAADKVEPDTTYGFFPKDGTKEFRFASGLPRSKSPMETLRWKYHAAPDDNRNFQPKVVLDVHSIPDTDQDIWGNHVFTVHRPSRALCAPETPNNWNGTLLEAPKERSGPAPKNVEVVDPSPVVAYHYIGSPQRYFERRNDLRRSRKRYLERSNITHGHRNDQWIDRWLPGFVEAVGVDTAAKLLVPREPVLKFPKKAKARKDQRNTDVRRR
ncbi:unnamed protein product [Pseudo-nitzschia multistriata]|uniref:Glycosyltransferase family 92 protein n=1 Tax=Pseudo-nitzschia multistriata TaxID=183589 RepID=A0A448ZFS6_9STRA|nr:unnamed protein product [Pseudo-nitzschia multistriata]